MPPTAGQREDRLAANFPERRQCEVRRTPIPRTSVNRASGRAEVSSSLGPTHGSPRRCWGAWTLARGTRPCYLCDTHPRVVSRPQSDDTRRASWVVGDTAKGDRTMSEA